jgi:hypothetical protein
MIDMYEELRPTNRLKIPAWQIAGIRALYLRSPALAMILAAAEARGRIDLDRWADDGGRNACD